MGIDNILIGSDLTDASSDAIAGALALGGARFPVLVRHVYDYPTHAGLDEYVEAACREALRGQIRGFVNQRQPVGAEMVFGRPDHLIADGSSPSTLLVVGRDSRNFAQRGFSRHFATKMARRATGPLLVWPTGVEANSPKKILVADDISEEALRCAEVLLDLDLVKGAEVKHVFVYDAKMRRHASARQGGEGFGDVALGGFAKLLQDRVAALNVADAKSWESEVIEGDSITETLIAKAESWGADLICVGATGKGSVDRILLGSVADALVSHSPIPVLVV